jgi:hypothetical protein
MTFECQGLNWDFERFFGLWGDVSGGFFFWRRLDTRRSELDFGRFLGLWGNIGGGFSLQELRMPRGLNTAFR